MAARARLLQLANDLRCESEAFDRVVADAARCVTDLRHRTPTYLELRGAGDIVHDFYNAVEHYLERVAVELDGGLPAGPDSHATLLARMARELPGVRPAVLRLEVRKGLDEYLRFRHLFRHRYGFEMEWEKLSPLLERIGAFATALKTDLDAFVVTLEHLAARLDPA